jgi:urease accessory protein UreF
MHVERTLLREMPKRAQVNNPIVFRAFALLLGFEKLKARGAYLRNRANNKRQAALLLRFVSNGIISKIHAAL